MIKEIELAVEPALVHDIEALTSQIVSALAVNQHDVKGFFIRKRSLDARSKTPLFRLLLRVYINEEFPPPLQYSLKYQNVKSEKNVIVVGSGPAGLFAALRLIELGYKPIILERGKDVKSRRRDIAILNKKHIVNPESNYCFGEGGAGTYSDGKLYTRSTKRGDVDRILNIFIQHGADPDIAVNARPHIGTNKLPQIIINLRETILNAGGEIYFETRVVNLIVKNKKIKGVVTANGEVIESTAVVLATGHSARDIYEMLHQNNIKIEAKPLAIGVRIEHPQFIIDQAQYHCITRHPNLPPAYYTFVEQVEQRGVFSFCMCPGGIIAPCATNNEEIVMNGWSPSKRNNYFANSGLVTQLNLDDIPGNINDPLRVMKYQKRLENNAFNLAGGTLVAPAQRLADFVEKKISSTLPKTSYLPGITSVTLDEILPENVCLRLRKALPIFGKRMKGYFTNEAVLVGIESRTSSPVRIPRFKDTKQHVEIEGLFPCGEGAGYAGGIISAAIDGEKSAEAVATFYQLLML